MWLGSNVFILLSDPRNIEVILSSSVHIEKADIYKFSLPWLGTGLLTSTDSLWHKRRKIITPTFHFKILEGFVEVFNSNAQILVEELKKHVADKYVDIYNNISLCDLDIIC
ncbi:unnamed protein product, partial [Timema podura]|nr:unnamed protein product [Timema podura]